MTFRLDSAHSYGESESMKVALTQLLFTIGSFKKAFICRDSDTGMASLQNADDPPPAPRQQERHRNSFTY